MKTIATAFALTALLNGCTASTSDTGGKNLFQQLTSDPPLPAELTTGVDVFPVANVRTFRRPLSFAPFRVAQLRTSWRKQDTSAGEMPISRRVHVGQASTDAGQTYRFTLMEGDQPLWESRCVWSGNSESVTYAGKTSTIDWPTSGALTLQCDFSKPGGRERAWSLEWGMSASTQGLGMKAVSEGRLAGPTGDHRITLLSTNSKILGDIPAGYIFHSGAQAVAAASTRGTDAPRCFTISRSASPEERSILAAASAALLLNEHLANTGDDD